MHISAALWCSASVIGEVIAAQTAVAGAPIDRTELFIATKVGSTKPMGYNQTIAQVCLGDFID